MRKPQTLLAIGLCLPNIVNTQTRHPFDGQFQQEMSMLTRDNPISLFLDWLASPAVQNILLFLMIMSILYGITFIILYTLIIREVLPANMTIFLKDWISIEQPVAVVNRKHSSPFELEQRGLQTGTTSMEVGQPILATITFPDKTQEETKDLRQQLMGRKIEIVLSNNGNLIRIE